MAIYHMQAKVVSRGSGRSAVAASAYMSCSRMYNDYDGIQHDYTRKHGLIYQEVMLPPMAPAEWKDREKLWNAVEAAEKTKDSRLAREFVVALPVELNKDSHISLLQNFIQENFVDMGMCADFAIHDTDGHNPHAHILLTVRPLNENGTWQYKTEKEYLCVKNGEEKGFTASEYKEAQKDGWEKQYRYKAGKKKSILLHPPLRSKAMNVLINIQKVPGMADKIPFLNNGIAMNNSVSGEQIGRILQTRCLPKIKSKPLLITAALPHRESQSSLLFMKVILLRTWKRKAWLQNVAKSIVRFVQTINYSEN